MPPTAILRTVLLGTLLVFLAACASGGGTKGDRNASSGDRLRVSLRNYQAEQFFELVSESHTDRLGYYSQERASAARKIQADEVMDALVAELDRLGLEDHMTGGRAPTQGGNSVLRWSLEYEENGRVSHWLVAEGTAPDERVAFNECLNTFLQLYNVSASFQTIGNEKGHAYFDDQDPSVRQREASRKR